VNRAGRERGPGPQTARLASFNLHHGAPATGPPDIAAAAQACRDLRADLLALQELDVRRRRSRFRHQPRVVAGVCGMHLVYAPALRRGPASYGIALLSRSTPGAVQYLALPGAGTERRLAVLARVELAGVAVSVAAVHLQPLRDIATEQLLTVLGQLRRRPGPQILMGDLNLGPDVVAAALRGWGFTTVVAPPTFPSDVPSRRIDWVVARGVDLSEPEVDPGRGG
jgi:endonuclease/exonuclease/phosphatase family metal-dependent hydrolase